MVVIVSLPSSTTSHVDWGFVYAVCNREPRQVLSVDRSSGDVNTYTTPSWVLPGQANVTGVLAHDGSLRGQSNIDFPGSIAADLGERELNRHTS